MAYLIISVAQQVRKWRCIIRSLTSTLLKAQQSGFIDVLVKIVLTSGASTYTYTKPRILNIKNTEDGSLQYIELVLDNSDGTLTALDLRGFKGILSSGAITSAGEEYSACAPMWVLAQEFDSDPNKLTCTITLVGICNLMATDEASEAYQPDDTDNKTVKTLIGEIIGATLACFNLCKAYEVVWDAGYDTLADTYKPKDAFRIYVGNNRNSAIDRLLDYTLNVKVVKADGKIHIFKPTTTGETYDYEYSLENGHPFFSKALRNRLVTPNYIKVQSRDDDDPKYSGIAKDPAYDSLPDELKKHHFKQTYLESDEQAEDIAEAILAKAQMWCEAGAASVPLNVGAEAFDYVKVTDKREGDYRIGNTGRLVRHYNVTKNEWRMAFVFGNWQNVRKALADLGIISDDLENYFSRLQVGDLYAEHILADNMDFVWIDPDNTIDLSKIGDNLDNLPDGEVFARVKSIHISAEGGIKLDENILYSPGYDPTTKWEGEDLDDLPNGVTYQRVRSNALTAEGMILLDSVITGTYGLVKETDISAGHIKLSYCVGDLGDIDGDLDDIDEGSTYKKLKATDIEAGHIKLSSYTQVSGQWYSENGVIIDATAGIEIRGGKLVLKDSGGSHGGELYIDTSGQLRLDPWSYIVTDNIMPSANLTCKLGDPTKRWQYVYCNILYGGKYSFTETKADLADLEYMELPRRTSAPAGYEGRMVYNHSTGYLNVYSSGAWWHANRDAGWA